MPVTKSTISELVDIFSEIHNVLLRENENNWVRGIDSVLDLLSQADANKSDLDETYKNVRSIYKTMYSGQGSFADFMIWRENFEERKLINVEFRGLTNRAWTLLDL